MKSFYNYMQSFSCWLKISNSIDNNAFNYLVLVQCDQTLLIIMLFWRQDVDVNWDIFVLVSQDVQVVHTSNI